MSQGDRGDLWVFAYGSLMWNPGFEWAEAVPARLEGYSRRLCIYSIHYRGRIEQPGLVLGLDRGGITDGLAYRICGLDAATVHARLTARELIYGVYRETRLPVHLRDGRCVMALTYVAERAHPSYAGRILDEERIRIVRSACGKAGTNLAYLASTMAHLRELGIRDRQLERLSARIGAFAVRAGPSNGSRTVPIARSFALRMRRTLELRHGARRHFSYRRALCSK